ncbi:fatty acid desaturase [Paraburkholderia sp. BCC1885]|uniref:fatty acid desaturase n=1 Tax=Paraburkholderia sp. BCC1885 TaxID=2562669 RepID=UPI001182E937|nr:fatty acid desaturase [Paraburkholderia sp. BCC1885]
MDSRAAAQAGPAVSAAGKVRRTPRRAAMDVRANLTLLAIVTLATALQLFGLPVLLREWGLPALLLIVPLVVLTPTHWGLIHEAIHGQLFAERHLNEGVARALAISFALPFDAVRFGHLMHHRFTREPFDRPDVVDASRPLWQAWFAHYGRLLGGLYAGELVLPLLAFMPARVARSLVARAIAVEGPAGADVQRLFANFAADPARRTRIRRDWLFTLALFALAFYLYRTWWPVLAVTMYLRGVWLSTADNLPHHGVSLDEPGRSRNFRVARIWQGVLMNHHLHRLHHQHPTLPWTALSALESETCSDPGGSIEPAYFRSALRQFRGPGAIDAATEH